MDCATLGIELRVVGREAHLTLVEPQITIATHVYDPCSGAIGIAYIHRGRAWLIGVGDCDKYIATPSKPPCQPQPQPTQR